MLNAIKERRAIKRARQQYDIAVLESAVAELAQRQSMREALEECPVCTRMAETGHPECQRTEVAER